MARLVGPDEASREVKTLVGRVFQSKGGRPAQLWADAGATIPADVLTIDGAPIPDSTVTIDSSSMLPLVQFPPNDVDLIYGTCDGGPAWPIYARTADSIALQVGQVRQEATTYTDKLPERIPFGAVRINPDLLYADHAAGPLTTPTYDGSGQAVHPAVYYNPQGFGADANGKSWRYWMVMTPYPGGLEAVENPSILVSDDGLAWQVPPGLTNPIDAPTSGFFPDVDLIEVDGTLWCLYAVTRAKSTTDGITWSARQTLDGATGSVSGTVIRDGDGFSHWSVLKTTDGTPYRLRRQRASTFLGPYGSPVNCTFPVPSGKDIWHIQIRKVGDTYVAAAAVCDKGTSGTATDLHFASSPDGITWTVGVQPLLRPQPGTWTSQQIYHSAIVPYDGRDGVLFGLWYTGVQTPNIWRIGYTEITTARARSGLAVVSQPNTMAAGQVIRGDSRNRLANPSLLIAASGGIVPTGYTNNLVAFTGHTWDEASESYTVSKTGSSGGNIQCVHTDTFADGELWSFSLELMLSDPAVGLFTVSGQWLTAADATVGAPVLIPGQIRPTAFRRFYFAATVPATAAKLRISIAPTFSTTGTCQFWMRRAQLEKAAVPTTYSPQQALVERAASGQTGNLREWQTALGVGQGARVGMAVTKDARLKSGAVNEQTTVGATGAAAALPANPLRYLRVELDDGTQGVIPVYRQA